MVGIVWEGGDGSRGDRIAHVGGLINVFASFFCRDSPLVSILSSKVEHYVNWAPGQSCI